MDHSESVAGQFLRLRGFNKIVFEPDGNMPPDFLADDRVAVEVRRLNQNEPGTVTPKGLEETEIPLIMRIQRLLATYDGASDKSWWVSVDFSRPLVQWEAMKSSITTTLRRVLEGNLTEHCEHEVVQRLQITFHPGPSDVEWVFHLGMISDDDSGGWIVGEVGEKSSALYPRKGHQSSSI